MNDNIEEVEMKTWVEKWYVKAFVYVSPYTQVPEQELQASDFISATSIGEEMLRNLNVDILPHQQLAGPYSWESGPVDTWTLMPLEGVRTRSRYVQIIKKIEEILP